MDKLDDLIKSWKNIREELRKDSVNPKLAPKDRKVKQLQAQIDAGTYKPDSKKIAGKMVEQGVFNKSGQWEIKKMSNYKGGGISQYNQADNEKRKKTRTAEERDVGPNKAVRQYTTSGSTMSDHMNRQLQAKNRKQPAKSISLSDEERKQLQERLSAKAKKDIKIASEDGN